MGKKRKLKLVRETKEYVGQPDETIFPDGKTHFETLIKDIEQAQFSIDLETYIFQKDHLGIRIANALAAAAERGVTVRVLVDGAGSPYWSPNFSKQLEKAGAETKVFHPFPWQLWNWSRSAVKLSWNSTAACYALACTTLRSRDGSDRESSPKPGLALGRKQRRSGRSMRWIALQTSWRQ